MVPSWNFRYHFFMLDAIMSKSNSTLVWWFIPWQICNIMWMKGVTLVWASLNCVLLVTCSRCNKKTWHVESSYILQPPKYLLLFVNRLRYINNNVTKDRCTIPMDTTVRLGPLKFSLRVTIDHHGPSIHSGHYTASINCCKKSSTEFRIIDSKNSSTAYVILYELIDSWFLDSTRRVGVWSLPWRWHILSIPLTTGRGTGVDKWYPIHCLLWNVITH